MSIMSTCFLHHCRQLLLITCCLCVLLFSQQVAGDDADDDFVVAAYIPEYRSYINVNKTAPFLTDLILFSSEPDFDGTLGACCVEPHHFDQAREARAFKKQNFPDEKPLKLWLSLGGAGRSNAFAKVASKKKLRKQFIQTLKEKVKKEQFDGVDFDWEAPQSHEDYQNYMHLLQEAHKELEQKEGILISVALHPRQVFHHTFYNHANRIHLMTYDMIDKKSGGHHASMEQMKNAIELLTNAKCPSSRIVVGIPAYARHGKRPGLVKTYSELVDGMEQTEPTVDLKDVAQRSDFKGYLFDSPNDIRRKVDFAVKAGYGGVFFWELGQDKQHDNWAPGGMLLEAAAEQARISRNAASDADEVQEL